MIFLPKVLRLSGGALIWRGCIDAIKWCRIIENKETGFITEDRKGTCSMEKLGDGVKKVLLAGIGAVAVTAEKSRELLDEMVKKENLP